MHEPFALLSAMALLAIAGLLIGLTKFAAPALIVASVLAAVAFFLLISRDASYEEEIDDLLHEHARQSRAEGAAR